MMIWTFIDSANLTNIDTDVPACLVFWRLKLRFIGNCFFFSPGGRLVMRLLVTQSKDNPLCRKNPWCQLFLNLFRLWGDCIGARINCNLIHKKIVGQVLFLLKRHFHISSFSATQDVKRLFTESTTAKKTVLKTRVKSHEMLAWNAVFP